MHNVTGIALVAPPAAHVRAEGGSWTGRTTLDPTKARKARHGDCRAGGSGYNLTLLSDDSVSALAALGLEGFNLVAGPFQRSGHEPAHRVGLPTHFLHGVDKQMHSGRRMSRNISV